MNKQELEQNFLHSGTTLVGVVCKDGIVMGSDRQSTAGNLVVGKNVQKSIQKYISPLPALPASRAQAG